MCFPTFGLVIRRTIQTYTLLYHLELYYDMADFIKYEKNMIWEGHFQLS
jgi:hypothetical protein